MTQRQTSRSALRADDLRGLREKAALSQTELAHRLGYSLKQVQRWEQGSCAPRLAAFEFLRGLLDQPSQHSEQRSFRFIDLFAGIGGLRRPFDEIGGECVFTSEWDKYSQATYRANFHVSHPIAGDIVGIPSEHIPQHDLLLAGFPCQPFSISGVSKRNSLGRPHGFACDTQGTLFFEVARILNFHRPRFFVLENVKNLTTHDGGRTFLTIKRTLTEELGYTIFHRVINAAGFVPQHRERIFIVGFRDGADFSWDGVALPDARKGPKLRTILHPEDGTEEMESPFTERGGRVAKKYILSDHLWTYLQDYAAKHKKAGNGFGFGLVGPEDIARTLSARYFKDGSEILVKRRRGAPRRLTPRECARLMGFDAPRESNFKIPVSDTQAYKQFGNSVAVPVVRHVAGLLKPFIIGTAPRIEAQLALPFLQSA
jgi:DNA (cytosine-5)-methyltransferase 1